MEIWKEIHGTNYLVSNLGNVVSSKFKRNGSNRSLKKISQQTGYYHVTLFVNGKRKQVSIHRLVAIAFLLNKENKPQVNHMDGDKKNNNLENLEWSTYSENRKHAFDKGLQRPSKSNLGKRYGDAHRAVSVIVTHKDGVIEKFSSIREAAHKYNVHESAISNCLSKKTKTAGGKQWQYA